MGQEKRYQIIYHRLVSGDIASLDTFWHERMLDAIENKLMVMPEFFGKPLRNSLAGWRTLRVGDYRVVFLIEKKMVRIVAIRHRRDGYEGVEKRI